MGGELTHHASPVTPSRERDNAARVFSGAALFVVACVVSGCAVEAEDPSATKAVANVGASLLRYQRGKGHCSAVAIDSVTALTAAHCIGDELGGLVGVDGVPRAVDSIMREPDRDLATLYVVEPFEHWTPLASRPIRHGDLLQVWGYGCEWPAVSTRAAEATSDTTAIAIVCPGDSGGAVIGFDGVAAIVHGIQNDGIAIVPVDIDSPRED